MVIAEEVHFAGYASSPRALNHSRNHALEETMEDEPPDECPIVVPILYIGSPSLVGCLVGSNHTDNQLSEF